MQTIRLVPHPAGPNLPDIQVSVAVAVSDRGLITLDYRLEGAVDRLLWPKPAPPRRQDSLWRTTCLEAFFATPGRPDYLEVNLSPTHAWAAYAFTGYRHGMRDAGLTAPVVTTEETTAERRLHATLPMQARSPFTHIAPTAVIETTDGQKTYLAPAHTSETPDFHTLAGMAPLPD